MRAHGLLVLLLCAACSGTGASDGGHGGGRGGGRAGGAGGSSGGGGATPAPVIGSIDPTSGPPTGGTTITISGAGFDTSAVPTIDGHDCASSAVIDSATVLCVTKPGTGGPYDVTVTHGDGQFATLPRAFSYYGVPVIQTVSPSMGPVEGLTTIDLAGSDFRSGLQIRFGVTPCITSRLVLPTLARCEGNPAAPGGMPGAVDVSVVNEDGQTGAKPAGYTYVYGPGVSGISPAVGPPTGGQLVTISGSGFLNTGTTSASLGGCSCSGVNVVSANQLRCTTSACSRGPKAVTVIGPDGQMTTSPPIYSYSAPATLAWTEAMFDWGQVNHDAVVNHTFTLRNGGDLPASNNLQVSLGGGSPAAWAIVGNTCSAVALDGGQSCTTTVRFPANAMQTAGPRAATLTAAANLGGISTSNLLGTIVCRPGSTGNLTTSQVVTVPSACTTFSWQIWGPGGGGGAGFGGRGGGGGAGGWYAAGSSGITAPNKLLVTIEPPGAGGVVGLLYGNGENGGGARIEYWDGILATGQVQSVPPGITAFAGYAVSDNGGLLTTGAELQCSRNGYSDSWTFMSPMCPGGGPITGTTDGEPGDASCLPRSAGPGSGGAGGCMEAANAAGLGGAAGSGMNGGAGGRRGSGACGGGGGGAPPGGGVGGNGSCNGPGQAGGVAAGGGGGASGFNGGSGGPGRVIISWP